MILQNSDRILHSFYAGFVFSTAQLGFAKISLAQLSSSIFLSKMNEAGFIWRDLDYVRISGLLSGFTEI